MQKCLGIITEGWQTWSEWSACSASCGNGHKTRERECAFNEYESWANACPDYDRQKVDEQKCYVKSCPYCQDAQICDNTFANAAFDPCKEIVDVEKYLHKCRSEVCQTGNSKAPVQVQTEFMKKCEMLGQPQIVCGLKEHLTSKECPKGQVWSSCKPQCQALKTCMGTETCDDKTLIEGCFCKEGYVLSDDKSCIKASTCEEHWEGWGSCSASCGTGTKVRNGYKDR